MFPQSSSVYNLLARLGVDKSIAYSSGARIIQSFTGFASIFFIAQFLTKAEQGFYYTFGSILAIQVFFELGLTNIITQYVAHELAGLRWKNSSNLEGEERNHSRLAHLLRFSVKWYAAIGFLLFFVILGVGIVFFGYYSKPEEDISWQIPWILVCIGTVFNLFISPLLAIIMGLERVKDVMKMRFYQQLIIPLSTWIGLAIGFHLYVLGIASILSALYIVIYSSFTDLRPIVVNLWKVHITERVSYMKEIFPYQWKIALSWVSGYFIFQLFNPVLFAYSGPVLAGQMGMTISVLNGINAFSYSWINTKVPTFSKLIALKDYTDLNRIFNSTIKQMFIVCIGLLFVMFVGVWGLRILDIPLGGRFLPYIPMIFMMGALVINQLVGAWATYLRCHKKEPFMVNSIVGAILCGLSTFFLGKYYGVYGMTAGYFTLTFLLSFWGYYIFKTCKTAWHGKHE